MRSSTLTVPSALVLALAALAQAQDSFNPDSSSLLTDSGAGTGASATDAAGAADTDTGASPVHATASVPFVSPSTGVIPSIVNGTTSNGNNSAIFGDSLNFLSPTCRTAVEYVLGNNSASGHCLYGSLLWASSSSGNSSVNGSTATNSSSTGNGTTTLTAFLNATCQGPPCSNATIINATQTIITSCTTDLAGWNVTADVVYDYAALYPLLREILCLKTSDPYMPNSTNTSTTTAVPMVSTALATRVAQSSAGGATVSAASAASSPTAASAATHTSAAAGTNATTNVPPAPASVTGGYCLISVVEEIQAKLATSGFNGSSVNGSIFNGSSFNGSSFNGSTIPISFNIGNITTLLIPYLNQIAKAAHNGSTAANGTTSTMPSSNSTISADTATPPAVTETSQAAPVATPATTVNGTGSTNSTQSIAPLIALVMEIMCTDCVYAYVDLIQQSAPWLLAQPVAANLTFTDFLTSKCSSQGYVPSTNGTLPKTITPTAQNSTYGFPITYWTNTTGGAGNGTWTTTVPQTNVTLIEPSVASLGPTSATGTAAATATAGAETTATDAVGTDFAAAPVASDSAAAPADGTPSVARRRVRMFPQRHRM